ncbi:MAG: GTPase Era [Clostridia bacterium]|nr:GTPase Era [Clostridia bacterium]
MPSRSSRGRPCARRTSPCSAWPSRSEGVRGDEAPHVRHEVAEVSLDGVGGGAVVLPALGVEVGGPEAELIGRIAALRAPAVLVINKIDTVKKEELLAVMQEYQKVHQFRAIVPISARTGEGVEDLLSVLDGFLQEGPQLFPDDMVTDQPERQVMAEILREKLLLCLDKEIPHGTAVEITKFSERENEIIDVDATIYCEKASHKGIIIGKSGAMLKKISTMAREDMEKFMGTKVYLETWVKVKENWRDNMNLIKNFGYKDE